MCRPVNTSPHTLLGRVLTAPAVRPLGPPHLLIRLSGEILQTPGIIGAVPITPTGSKCLGAHPQQR